MTSTMPPLERQLRMARAARLAVEAGWLAALADRVPKKLHATASSPLQGHIE